MTVIFGVCAPPEHLVNGYTFMQLLYDGMGNISFRREGDACIFEAENNWIGEPRDLTTMLAGGIIPVPHEELEISRVETTYRYVFNKILFGPSGKETQFPKDGTVPDVDWHKTSTGPFTLKLICFGEYYWDEVQSMDSASIHF